MMMSEGEIIASYRGAKKKGPQVGILADLNACPQDTILEILKKHIDPKELPRKREKKMEKKATDGKNVTMEKLESRVKELESMNKCLQDQMEKSDKEHYEAMDLKNVAMNKLCAERKNLKTELEERKSYCTELKANYELANESNVNLNNMLADLKDKVTELKMENEELKTRNEELEELDGESNLYDEQSHMVYENQLRTTVNVLVDELAAARKEARI